MKFSIIALTGLAALVAAQDSTASAPTATVSLSPEASCAAKCAGNDICCKAQCYKVPCPDDSMANDTTACAAKCPQGSGTPSDTEAYAKCQQSCFSSLFFPATVNSAAATQTSGFVADTTGTGVNPTGTSKSSDNSKSSNDGSDSNSESSTTSAAGAANSTGAASRLSLELGGSAAGLLGVVMAALAL